MVQNQVGLVVGSLQDLIGGLTAHDQDGLTAGVEAAFNVRVDPVPHHHGFFRGAVPLFHGQPGHIRLGFADDQGSLSADIIEHIADAAAIGNAAKFRGAYIVGVCGDIGQFPGAKHF